MYVGIIGRTNMLEFEMLMERWGNTLKGNDIYFNGDYHL
jgi:hypothetical protein